MPDHLLKPKAGPVSFASRLKENSVKPESAALVVSVEPLWTTKELGAYLGKSKNSLSDFLNRTPDFPAFKIGSEWRADPEEVKAWIRRQRVRVVNNETAESA